MTNSNTDASDASDASGARERERVAALVSYDILDTAAEDTFDEFARVAATLLGAPLAAVSFVDADRLWLKACHGPRPVSMLRDGSPCLQAIETGDVTVIPDTASDARVSRHPWVTGEPQIRFYAAAPLIDSEGHALGTVCIMDAIPRQFTFEQRDCLRMLGRHVVAQLELRRRVEVFKRNDSPRQTLLTALKNAVRGGEFVVHYQPRVSLDTGRTVGLEALIRWDRPGYGLVSPNDFIPLLEESGLILEVGAWVLEQSADHHRDWMRKGLRTPRIAVNISPAQFNDRRFLEELTRATGAGDPSRGGVDLEISESVLCGNVVKLIDTLTAIRGMGCSVAVDNFGTGHTSWRHLTRLPIDMLKIDRSFTSSVTQGGAGVAVVTAMIALAHGLGFKAAAEGVETQAQRERLTDLGCDEIQGYLISPPLTKREIEHFLGDAPADVATRRFGAETEADIELLFGGRAP